MDIVGFAVNIGNEQELASLYFLIGRIEFGNGYSNSFDNGKPVNIYIDIPSEWWRTWEISRGIDVNINGYGFALGVGAEQSLNLHLQNRSIEFYTNAMGCIGSKFAIEDSTGNYIYAKTEINTPELALVATAVYYCTPYILGLLSSIPVPEFIPVFRNLLLGG